MTDKAEFTLGALKFAQLFKTLQVKLEEAADKLYLAVMAIITVKYGIIQLKVFLYLKCSSNFCVTKIITVFLCNKVKKLCCFILMLTL